MTLAGNALCLSLSASQKEVFEVALAVPRKCITFWNALCWIQVYLLLISFNMKLWYIYMMLGYSEGDGYRTLLCLKR